MRPEQSTGGSLTRLPEPGTFPHLWDKGVSWGVEAISLFLVRHTFTEVCVRDAVPGTQPEFRQDLEGLGGQGSGVRGWSESVTRLHGCPRRTRSEQGCRWAGRHAGRESEPRGDPVWARLSAASALRTHAGAASWEKQTLGSRVHVAAHHMQSCLPRVWPLYGNWKKPPLAPGKQSHVSTDSSRWEFQQIWMTP